jgi:DNA transposition AAA+ family ATPase
MNNPSAPDHFLITKEYRRFEEFCDACRRYRYIGLCYGAAGVGKTLSARTYANWDRLEQLFKLTYFDLPPEQSAYNRETIFCTAPVYSTPLRIANEVDRAWRNYENLTGYIQNIIERGRDSRPYRSNPRTAQLIIVDEADRLKTQGLEQIRDMYDQRQVGLILIGMPGMEKRLSRYPQLYSRVGFVHHFKPLSNEEMHFALQHKWQQLGLTINLSDFTAAEAVAAIIRITGGNFRLLQRLFSQIERVMQINELRYVTKEVVESARELLVIGPS